MRTLCITYPQSPDPISFPEPQRVLGENEGSGKGQFLGDPDWLSEM